MKHFLSGSIGTFLLVAFLAFCTMQNCSSQALRFSETPSADPLWLKRGVVVWPRLPVRVAAQGAMSPLLTEDIVIATQFWNNSIGCEVFALSTDPKSEIIVSMGAKVGGTHWIASAKYVHREADGIRYWGNNIFVYDLKVNRYLRRFAAMSHELGHALGLRDVTSKWQVRNVMVHELHGGLERDIRALETLNKLYCHR